MAQTRPSLEEALLLSTPGSGTADAFRRNSHLRDRDLYVGPLLAPGVWRRDLEPVIEGRTEGEREREFAGAAELQLCVCVRNTLSV
ncbi:hypothetical protein Q8A67_014149 [Cirrhinus molitorella]|uniref:Uncharacterized protein n=1 Tax=Cirrhinus molitorella TaxID=172907 RepID=A0AA88TI06_9TELE|nr:hypothetical protein Q8A67_014149 [Cirrhinus molitorella]